MIENINELKQGCVLSESSHYRVKNILGSSVILEHFESKNEGVRLWMSVQAEK